MAGSALRFADRTDAGRALATRLAGMGLTDPVVYALPRGGVPLAVEIGRVLEAPVELVLVRKIGAEKVEWLEGPHEPLKLTIEDIKALKAKFRAWVRELKRGAA